MQALPAPLAFPVAKVQTSEQLARDGGSRGRVLEVRPQRHRPCKEGTHGLSSSLLSALQPRSELLLSRGKFLSPCKLRSHPSSTFPGKYLVFCIPGFFFFFQTVPNLHVVQGTPATVRVPRAQALPASRVLLTGFHRDPGDLAERKDSRLDQGVMPPDGVFRLNYT